jgi:hypothetical protein
VVARSALATAVVALAAVQIACGHTGDKAERPSQPPSTKRAMRLSCQRSWTPTPRTLVGGWRQSSIRAGSVTLLLARRLAHAPIGGDGRAVKIPTLVHPRTPVTIAIGRSGRSTAGFVPLERSGQTAVPMADTDGTLLLEGCDAAPIEQRADVPKRLRSVRELSDVGYPLTIAVARPACVALEITAAGRTIRRTISIGAGRCD